MRKSENNTTTTPYSGSLAAVCRAVLRSGCTRTRSGGGVGAKPTISFPDFFLRGGNNLLTAAATDAQGRVSTAAISVSVEQTASIINIEYPRPCRTTRKAWVDVRGMDNDAVEGMIGATEPQLTVNGVAAQVADRIQVAPDMPCKTMVNKK